jgi:hypothetical protein
MHQHLTVSDAQNASLYYVFHQMLLYFSVRVVNDSANLQKLLVQQTDWKRVVRVIARG